MSEALAAIGDVVAHAERGIACRAPAVPGDWQIEGAAERYLRRLDGVLAALDREEIEAGIREIARAWQGGRQIIAFGNGGSALTALHCISDWVKSVPAATGRRFRGQSLADNVGLVLSYGNDACFDDIFVAQLRNVLEPGDLVIGISGSGNSENVIRAIDHANDHGAVTLGLCGFDGGRLRRRARRAVWARVDDMQLAEDSHMIFGHIAMQALMRMRAAGPSR